MKVDIVPCGPPVNESEQKAIEHLKSRLIGAAGDGHWILLTNLMSSATHRRQADEIDIVAIGPPGVRVIEVKHWTASWVKRNSLLVDKEAHGVTMKARRIGTTLRKRFPDLGHVEGAFLTTEDRSRAKGLERAEVAGARFHTLRNWKEVLGLEQPETLSATQVRMIARSLAPESGLAVEGSLKRIADYTGLALRSPVAERFHRIYRAIHPSRRDRVILHLYDLSASDGPRANERARREFDALHRLQHHSWAPRIVDSFQDATGYAGEISFFTIADPGAPSVEERASDHSWGVRRRLAFARNAIGALAELHESGAGGEPMLHRNLSPATIRGRHDDSPVFPGLLHARIREATPVSTAGETDAEESCLAPEVRAQGRGAADRRSDVYSLCASLARLFEGAGDPESSAAAEALLPGVRKQPETRSALDELKASLSRLLGEPVEEPRPAPPPARFWSEDQEVRFRNRDYRIVSRLGSGGVGTAFKVVGLEPKTKAELGAYVGKVVGDAETGRRVLSAYDRARPYLGETGLSTIFETAEQWSDRSFVALMTWIEGEPLSEYAGLLHLHAQDLGIASGELLAIRWLLEACEALGVLHENGLVHGDISPGNLIVSDDRIVVTDYDCVGPVGEQALAPGTVEYCSPSYLEGLPAEPADDLYALASSFFQILFEREPFQFGGERAKERGLNWEGLDRSGFETVGAFLDRATHPDPTRRFRTVVDARAALKSPEAKEPDERQGDASGPAAEPMELTDNRIPWIEALLRAYPGSPRGNDETRGLDSDFAARTYVPTDLEESLHQDIGARRVQLVVLSGNAGDGKTALLQHLAGRLGLGEHRSADRIIEARMDDGLTVRVNLDGSAAWKERSADQLLDDILAPFLDGPSERDLVHLLAINDGRLLEWIEDRDETALTGALRALMDGDPAPDANHIRFVDLNRRSLVGHVSPGSPEPATDFLDRLLDRLYGGEEVAQISAPCRSCRARQRCEIWRAARLFGPDDLAAADRPPPDRRRHARDRLIEALQAVHLRGEAQITMRELRATLVHVLFGVHFCTDYHAGGAAAEAPVPYFERAFSPTSPRRQGEVLRELARLDPALESHPRIDRRLVYPRSANGPEIPRVITKPDLDAARRRAFFEWTPADLEDAADDPDALPLAGGRHLRDFRRLVAAVEAPEGLTTRVCQGISRLEALPPQALRSGRVPLRIVGRTPTETVFWVEKELADFRLAPPTEEPAPGLDRLPREAVLTYRGERLPLGAELFSILLDLSEGYQLGAVSTDDVFAQLAVFVQRITREDERRLFAWTPMDEGVIHELEIRLDGPVQRLELRRSGKRDSD